jgi:hypothetical protein
MTDTIQETKPLRYGLHSFRCPTCNRRAHTVSEVKFDDDVLIDLSCGHQTVKTALSGAGELVSLDGKTLRDYQITSVEFSEKAGGNVVILHEMGLGKTPISIALVKRNFDTMCPALVLCKSKLKEQWAHEIIRWAGPEFVPQLIENGREKPLAGFRFYVISLDLLRNIRGLFSDVKFKTVIIDEVQLIKNDDAKRTVAVRELAREAEFKIGLSGTYIKNNAPFLILSGQISSLPETVSIECGFGPHSMATDRSREDLETLRDFMSILRTLSFGIPVRK